MRYLRAPLNRGQYTVHSIRRSHFSLQGVLVHAAYLDVYGTQELMSLTSTLLYEAPQPGLICRAAVATLHRVLRSHPRTRIKDFQT